MLKYDKFPNSFPLTILVKRGKISKKREVGQSLYFVGLWVTAQTSKSIYLREVAYIITEKKLVSLIAQKNITVISAM